jgi:hypothetical protein
MQERNGNIIPAVKKLRSLFPSPSLHAPPIYLSEINLSAPVKVTIAVLPTASKKKLPVEMASSPLDLTQAVGPSEKETTCAVALSPSPSQLPIQVNWMSRDSLVVISLKSALKIIFAISIESISRLSKTPSPLQQVLLLNILQLAPSIEASYAKEIRSLLKSLLRLISLRLTLLPEMSQPSLLPTTSPALTTSRLL